MTRSISSRFHRAALLPVIALLACLPSSWPAEPDPAGKTKPSGGGWAELFKIHWQNRVRSFKEQNLAWQNVVLLGDSITEGFDVTKHFPGRRVLNRGIGADVIGNNMPPDDPRGVLQRLDNSVLDCAATDVFILIGINDLNSGRDVATMEAGYRELLGRLRKEAPRLRIHVQSVLPTRGAHDRQNAPVREFNARLKKLAAESGCGFIDLHPLMADDEGRLKAEFTNDGLHLTDAAYLVWRAEILKAMQWDR
jgi:lysophospholipase L1-like esterase